MDIKHKIVKLVGIRDLPLHEDVIQYFINHVNLLEDGDSYRSGKELVVWIVKLLHTEHSYDRHIKHLLNNTDNKLIGSVLDFLNHDDVLVHIKSG